MYLASAPAVYQFSHLLKKSPHALSVYVARLQIRARFWLWLGAPDTIYQRMPYMDENTTERERSVNAQD